MDDIPPPPPFPPPKWIPRGYWQPAAPPDPPPDGNQGGDGGGKGKDNGKHSGGMGDMACESHLAWPAPKSPWIRVALSDAIAEAFGAGIQVGWGEHSGVKAPRMGGKRGKDGAKGGKDGFKGGGESAGPPMKKPRI